MTKKLILEGLDCAHCASKIESRVQKIEGVDSAHLNFIDKTLIINFSNTNLAEDIVISTEKIVKKLEPHVDVKELLEEKEVHSEKVKTNIFKANIKIFAAIGLFIASFFLPEVSVIWVLGIAYILVGYEVLIRAFKNILNGQVFDENFLMAIATIGAIILGEYREAVGVMMFYQVGELFQDYAVGKSRDSIKKLLDIKAEYANVYRANKLLKVKPELVNVGDIIVVKPGEKIPLDGVVISGNSFLDTSAITGEPIPKRASEGEVVYSGYINQNSPIQIEVSKEYKDSTVYKILELVENASSKKATTEKFITKFAKYYTPAVVGLALMLAVLPPIISQTFDFAIWINRALIFLVVSCPCALVISIPLGFFGGIGAASKHGILVKGGNYLEILANVDTVVFDKTGTLTYGNFKIDSIKPNNCSEEYMIERLKHVEYYSNHPIAKSILEAYPVVGEVDTSQYTEIPGKGVSCIFKGHSVIAGNIELMNDFNIKMPKIVIEDIGTFIHIAENNNYLGYVVIKDQIKNDAYTLSDKLKKQGVRETVLLTGDKKDIATKIADLLKIDKVYAELLPADKVKKYEEIKNSKKEKQKIAFIGDGINDAPVLAMADVGISMGALGSDAAIEAADIVIMNDQPSQIVTGIIIAKETRKIVMQNIVMALGIKAIVLVLGALGMASMWAAVFADVGVALLAILNATRILAKNYDK